ncbi:carbohydrate kinase family protein [Methylococcus sp. EFPC2]|uniref:carbohydrate kinase family protein n=1 Tax=Methylococcus sp. EFPC2 TaxID=2812648 RepID=UPI001966F418|nr:carbohydrate kinase family protein [Methylococcus sp. EFPC2]QSA96216.1 carbohydrate kinase family protein [Methylococcus sp. EFPC2]
MSALICGSMAYDTIMVFHDRFKNHILPEQVHILNVSFLVPELRREFGGCAGNIAYNLKLLGGDPRPMATVGKDFQPYAQWLSYCGIDQTYIRTVDESYTAQAYITTDMDDNQITAFHPGAMSFAHLNTVPTKRGIKLGIVAPDGKDGMVQHAEQFVQAGIPFIFDPGQGMPMFNGEELLHFVELADWITLNDYEAHLMQERTGLTPEQLAEKVSALIVTKGANGSLIYTEGKTLEIPPAKPKAVLDPTGCGDAFRAGLLYGLKEEFDWPTIGRIASLLGAIKVETAGTQNHTFTPSDFHDRYRENFGHGF